VLALECRGDQVVLAPEVIIERPLKQAVDPHGIMKPGKIV
jgi:FAD/FMN-containing dehydrogenase